MGFGLLIGFTEHLQLITTSKDYTFTVLQTSQITIGHTRSSVNCLTIPLKLDWLALNWQTQDLTEYIQLNWTQLSTSTLLLLLLTDRLQQLSYL
jgi:hypothetical protein